MRPGACLNVLFGLAVLCGATAVNAQAEGFEGTYRGSFVCEKLRQSADMLRAPFDMNITGQTVVFARPVFNRNGTRVVGTEIATGSVAENGTLQLKSNWSAGQIGYQGSYSGAINGKIGTLTGSQAWKLPGGSEKRACSVAFGQRS